MAPETVVNTPEAPAILPAKWQAQWKKTYAEAFQAAQADEPDDAPRQRQMARREANRMLRTPKLTSYEEAAALEDWQVVFRGEVDGVLKVVTCDGKKYRFPVPASVTAERQRAAAKAAAAGEDTAKREADEKAKREAEEKARQGGQR